jgi:hypothetical protein
VEVKSNSKRLWRSRLRRMRKRQRHPSLQMRLGRRQQELDRFLVKVAQKENESTDGSDSVSDNESRPTQ